MIKKILAVSLAVLMVFLLFCFYAANFDITAWDSATRGACAFSMAWAAGMSFTIAGATK